MMIDGEGQWYFLFLPKEYSNRSWCDRNGKKLNLDCLKRASRAPVRPLIEEK